MDNTANYQNNTQNFKFCRKCGRKLLVDAEFCDSCGTKQISTETADIAETVSEPDVQYSNPQPVTPSPVYNGNNTTAGNAGVQYPQKKSKAPLIIGICVGVLLVIVSIIVTVLVVSSFGGKDSQSFGEVSAPATSYNNGNSQNTLPETSAPDNNSSAPDNNSSAPVTDLKPGTAEINRSGSSETSGNSFLVHDDGVYLLGISNVNDAVTDGYAISAMIPDSYFVEGKQFDKTALSLSNCYGEYYVMEDGVNNVYTTKDNPEMFVYMTVTLLKISGNSAEFKIEAAISYEQEEFTFEGRGYSVDSSNSGGQTVAPDSNYTPPVNPTIPTINNCSVCHGSGLCQVCHGRGGMSYNTYGQGGDGWVVCQGCKGNRRCKYCNGTGKN